jgi:hypothetical protein
MNFAEVKLNHDRDYNDSGAVNWGTVISDGIKVFDGVTGGLTLASAIKEHLNDNQQREDFTELLARQSM